MTHRCLSLFLVAALAACSDEPSAGLREDGSTTLDVVDDGGSTLDAGALDDAGSGGGADAGVGDDAGVDGAGSADDASSADAADAEADVAVDAETDAGDDVVPDGGPADVGSDAPVDTSPDAGADAAPDVGIDTSPDVAEDTAPDIVEPPATSPYERGVFGVQVYDESASIPLGGGSREMDVRLFVPTVTTGAPYPVIIFSHGFQLNGEGYDTIGNRLATHGFVGVFPSYGDNALNALAHTELAELVSGWIDWVETESRRGGSRIAFVADPERIGVAGHSRGGKQSILATIQDARIQAVFGIDPVDAGPPVGDDPVRFPSVTPELMDQLVVPAAFLGSGRGGDGGLGGIFPACAPTEDNYNAYYVEAGSPSFSYLVEDSGHLDYVDDCGLICFTCPGAGDAAANRSFATATLIAFFEVFVAGDARYRPWVDGAEVTSSSPTVTWESR